MRSSAGADGGASRDRRQRSNDAGRHGEECRLLAPCDSSSLPCLSDLPGSTNRRPGSPILRRASPLFVRHWYAPYLPSASDLPGPTNRRPGSPICRGLGSPILRRASSISPACERSTMQDASRLCESLEEVQVGTCWPERGELLIGVDPV